MKNYYYVSSGIIEQFPDLEKSKPFKGPNFVSKCYVAVISDFDPVKKFVENYKGCQAQFAYECVDSQVDLTYDAVEYDDEDNEIEVSKTLNKYVCKEWGLIAAIEIELGLTKEQNIAYAIYKLSQNENVNPIQFIDMI